MIDFQVLGGFGNRQTDVQTFVLLESRLSSSAPAHLCSNF